MDYTTVIGLEVHVQLATESKMFCGCSTRFGAPPNSQTCPVCIGMPGVLPVMNRTAFQLALKTAVALHCDIAAFTKWDRKNYYYPDLPKNYQISQYDLPFSRAGYLEIPAADGGTPKRVRITRVHLEEDAGKLLHSEHGGDSRVDLNRAGTPLLEIVSEPDMRSPAEAKAYLEELRLLLRYLEVSDCNMQEGSLRCDANVNIHLLRDGETVATPIVEVKNMNSFRAVERAMAYEAQRQFDDWRQTGNRLGDVPKATAGWDDAKGVTVVQRRKEDVSDYRYFPEPDLVPVVVGRDWVASVRGSLGELPAERRARLKADYALSDYDAGVLIDQSKAFADYFEEVVRTSGSAKMASNWLQQDVLRTLNERKIPIGRLPIPAASLGELIGMVNAGKLNTQSARQLFAGELARAEKPLEGAAVPICWKTEGLEQISDSDELRRTVARVLDANPQVIADYQKGKKREQVEGFARGLVMKETRGKANSSLVQQFVSEELARRAGA